MRHRARVRFHPARPAGDHRMYLAGSRRDSLLLMEAWATQTKEYYEPMAERGDVWGLSPAGPVVLDETGKWVSLR